MKKAHYLETFAIHCPNKKTWDKVCQKIEKESDLLWIHNGKKPTENNYDPMFGKETCIVINKNLSIGTVMMAKTMGHYVSAKKFLAA